MKSNSFGSSAYVLLVASTILAACFLLPDFPCFRRRLVSHHDGLRSDGGHRQLTLPQIKSFGGTPPNSRLPLQECEGDCDFNKNQCAAGLVCFEKDEHTDVPGCTGGLGDSSRTDYCVRKELVGGLPSPTKPMPTPPSPSPVFPHVRFVANDQNNMKLGRCEGDCDYDSDCKGNMECYQRRKYEAAPGCSGGDIDDSYNDYCAPASKNTSSPPSGDHFRLKLYWQSGYFWQEERRERKWCAMYKYKGLPGNGLCWYANTKRLRCRNDQLYIAKCSNHINQKFKFIKLSNNEVQITLANGEDLCFQRSDRQIYLRPCNAKEERQRWFSPKGSFDGPRFELSQRSFSSQCITQNHHPKAGEVVELHSCKAARSKHHETSFWNKYY